MAYFAELDTNSIVQKVVVIDNNNILDENGQESELIGIEFCRTLFGLDTNWVQTSYNAKIRGKYAGPGDTYDKFTDKFYTTPPVTE
jgi:hypothetical protein